MEGIVRGPIRLDSDMDISGMVEGDVTIPAPHRLVLSGMVTGDVIVEAGASLVVDGMISGRLVNRGGSVELTGMAGQFIGEDAPGQV